MGKVLICAEKPSQAKKLAEPFPHKNCGDHIAIEPCSMFPQGAVVISAVGHILELCSPSEYDEKYKAWSIETLPIFPAQWKLKVIDGKQRVLNTFKKFLKDPSIDLIVHAADPAQEGQLLLDEIYYFLGNKKPVKRLWTSSLTKESVRQAFRKMKDNNQYKPLYYAALARQRADWLVGMSSSRALTCLLREKGISKTFSAGRVQTALVGIIYQREKEIETFISKPYFDLFATFQFGSDTLIGKWVSKDTEHIFDLDESIVRGFADYCKGKPAEVYSVVKEEKRTRPPQFYNLSSLQMHANKIYGLSPSEVLSSVQILYDQSYVTYPRSDSKHLTPEEAKWMPTILSNLGQLEQYRTLVAGATRDISQDKRYTDSSQVTDHYAIVVTEEFVDPSTLAKREQLIYDLIAKSVIAAHYPDFQYETNEILITLSSEFGFKSRGKQIRDLGWKSIYADHPNDTEEQTQDTAEGDSLPDLVEGQVGLVLSTELKEGATTPPSRFTQGDLIKVMTNAGHWCSNKEDFKNTELVLGTEATRSNIIGTVTNRYVKVQKNLVYLLPEGRILIEALGLNSFLTSILTTGRMERYLREIEKGKGSVGEFVKRIEQITASIVEKLKEDALSWDFNHYVDQIQKAEEIGKCPECGAPVVERENSYVCINHKNTGCPFRLYKVKLNKTINRKNAQKMLETGQTALIKDFISSKEKPFDAFIYWDTNTKKTGFRFPN